VSELASQPRAKVAHAVPGRLRVRIDTPPGQGKLGHLAAELERMPDTQRVRANHTARSVTVTYDPSQVSAPDLLDRLHQLGLIALDLADPHEWPAVLASEVIPLAEDPTTVAGGLNRGLMSVTHGNLDLFRLTVALLLGSAGLQVRGSLLRGEGIPWLRVLTYILAASSIWSRHREGTTDTLLATLPG